MGRPRTHDRELIVKLYQEGFVPAEIARKVATHPHPDVVQRIVRAAGASRPPGRPRRQSRCTSCGSTDVVSELL